MVQETWWQWTRRVGREMMTTPWSVFTGPNMITLGAYSWIFPFKSDTVKTLPTSVANRSFYMFSLSTPDIAGIFLLILYGILDTVQTPGGIKFDDDSIDAWKTQITDEEKWWVTTRDWYGWNWWNRKVFQSDNMIANAGGLYKIRDLILDVSVTFISVILMILMIKNRTIIMGKVSGMFGWSRTRKRRKAMKELADVSVDQGEDILARLEMLVQTLDARSSISALAILEDEIEPGIDEILSRKPSKIRL